MKRASILRKTHECERNYRALMSSKIKTCTKTSFVNETLADQQILNHFCKDLNLSEGFVALTDQVSHEQGQVDDVEVEDDAIVAKEAACVTYFRQLKTQSNVMRQKLHGEGHRDDNCRDAPRPNGIPEFYGTNEINLEQWTAL